MAKTCCNSIASLNSVRRFLSNVQKKVEKIQLFLVQFLQIEKETAIAQAGKEGNEEIELQRQKEARERVIEQERQERKQQLNAWRVGNSLILSKYLIR